MSSLQQVADYLPKLLLSLLPNRRRFVLGTVLAIVFATISSLGQAFDDSGSAAKYFDGGFASLQALVEVLVLSVWYLLVFLVLIGLVDRSSSSETTPAHSTSEHSGLTTARNIRFARISFLVILSCYLFILVILYPGNVTYDGYSQINQFAGISSLSNGHPVLSTYIIGIIFNLGRAVLDDNFGVFLYLLVQSLALASVFSSVCQRIRGYGYVRLSWLVVVFFGICPIWPMFAATIVKDSMFMVVFVAFCLLLTDALETQERLSNYKTMKLAIVAFLVCLMRNNGIYAVLPSLVLAALVGQRYQRSQMALSAGAILSTYFVWTAFLLPALGVAPINANEMMSIPYQQTARYIVNHSDEISAEDRAILSDMFDVDSLPSLYDPVLSDPVKANSRVLRPTKSYVVLWVKMFFRHPETYLSATFHNTYGYYYPFYSASWESFHAYIIGSPVATGAYDIHYVFDHVIEMDHQPIGDEIVYPWHRAPSIARMYVENWQRIPVLRGLLQPGIYSWSYMLVSAYVIEKRQYRLFAALAPSFLLFLTCIASPVNGSLRYSMPFMTAAILLIPFVVKAITSAAHHPE